MPKSLALGNNNMMVCLDKNAEVRDLYFPHIGLENHTFGSKPFVHKVGIWAGSMSWLDDEEWNVDVKTEHETLASHIIALNKKRQIQLEFNDVVYNEKNIFIRKVAIKNLLKEKRNIRIFFHHQFEIGESHRKDTAYYDPGTNTVIHYKGRRVFLLNASVNKEGIDDYSTGNFDVGEQEGTHKDAEDGELSKNAIEHGKVDSVIGKYFDIDGDGEVNLYYWMAIGKSVEEVTELNAYLLDRTPEHLVKTTKDYWNAWVNKQNFSFFGLDANIVDLFKKSLFIIRAHTDNDGAIIASGDSDMLQGGKDTYGYMWPRDGAFSAMALDKAGDSNVARRFFEFCNDVITGAGYFLHKYRPDKSIGSSWHPWVRDGNPELPIQEDETALVIYALGEHYKLSRDLEFIEEIYNSLIRNAAEFMASHVDKKTKLPLPSYDLWEEKYGVHTFTCGTVYGALHAAAEFARLLGKEKSSKEYIHVAEKIKEATLKYLWNEEEQSFCKMAWFKDDGSVERDNTIDMSSVYGLIRFGMLDASDEKVKQSIKTVEEKLACKTPIGGVGRYIGDDYYRTSQEIPGNPWFITTLWLAQYYIMATKKVEDLEPAKYWLEWVTKYALPSGILSEQINPYTGEQISAAPLTWSHSQFIIAVIQYLDKLEDLGICKACNPVK
jgi:glucoamylase